MSSPNDYVNMKGLAARLDISYQSACGLKWAGMPLVSGRTTEKEARKWMREHDDFSVVEGIKRRWAKKRQVEREKQRIRQSKGGRHE